MSNITAALVCCCGETPEPGNCCTQFPLPFPPSMTISWTGNIFVLLPSCECGPVIGFECPCSGSMYISGGIIASGPRVIFEGGCGYQLENFATPGQSSIFCPCSCVWEYPPGSGQFFRFCEDFPEGCGPFVDQASAGLHLFGANLKTRRWEVWVAFQSYVLRDWTEPTGIFHCSFTACEHGVAFGTRAFSPLAGFDTLQALTFIGPEVVFCPDGTVDIRSAFGSYNPQGAFAAACPNTSIVHWNPGTVIIS